MRCHHEICTFTSTDTKPYTLSQNTSDSALQEIVLTTSVSIKRLQAARTILLSLTNYFFFICSGYQCDAWQVHLAPSVVSPKKEVGEIEWRGQDGDSAHEAMEIARLMFV